MTEERIKEHEHERNLKFEMNTRDFWRHIFEHGGKRFTSLDLEAANRWHEREHPEPQHGG